MAAARAATVEHLVFVSVSGADAMPIGYFRAKAGAERAVAESGIPFTTLRAAQFHSFALMVVRALAESPVVLAVRDVRWEPVDVRVAAARLVGATLSPPAGLAPDIAGPQIFTLRELPTPTSSRPDDGGCTCPARAGQSGAALPGGRQPCARRCAAAGAPGWIISSE